MNAPIPISVRRVKAHSQQRGVHARVALGGDTARRHHAIVRAQRLHERRCAVVRAAVHERGGGEGKVRR